MISTLTKAECIDALSHFDRGDIVVATCTFGDRARTMQAVPLGDLTSGFITSSSYSDSGYAVVEEGDEDDGDTPIHFFEPGDVSEHMTVGDFLDNLTGLDDDELVVAAWNYGDRGDTLQAIGLNEVNEIYLNRSSYSDSGYAVVEEGDEDDDAVRALVINYNAL